MTKLNKEQVFKSPLGDLKVNLVGGFRGGFLAKLAGSNEESCGGVEV